MKLTNQNLNKVKSTVHADVPTTQTACQWHGVNKVETNCLCARKEKVSEKQSQHLPSNLSK